MSNRGVLLTELEVAVARESRAPGVVVPKPILPDQSMIIAVVVAVKVEVEMTKSGERLADETLETDNLPQGVEEPTPRELVMDEAAVVEVAMKLVKVNWPPLVRAKPAASIADVHGVCDPPPQPEPVPVTRPADEICRHWEEAVVIPEITRAEVEAVLETVSKVVVALVVVAFRAVKFGRVVDELTRSCWRLETAVELSALKEEAATSPATDSWA